MALCHTLGYPRIGPRRELKQALESFWRDEATAAALVAAAGRLRTQRCVAQRDAGLDLVTAGDFSLYDHVLDAALDLGALTLRGGAPEERLRSYFELARGASGAHAMEMTKWFDTNYHFLVPELDRAQQFTPDPRRIVADARDAAVTFASVKPVLVGPLTFLWLSKGREPFERLTLLPALMDAYEAIFAALHAEGVEWVQVDEPALVQELPAAWLDAYERELGRMRSPRPKLLLATYFGSVEALPSRVVRWPYDGIHLDLVRARDCLEPWARDLPSDWILSAGVVDGRNIWRNDLSRTLDALEPVHARLRDRLWIAPSCSLLHVPVSLGAEGSMAPGLRSRLAFADEKLAEVRAIATALDKGRSEVREAIEASDMAAAQRRTRAIDDKTDSRASNGHREAAPRAPYHERQIAQQASLRLPPLPTTTIGSFPQTPELRRLRAEQRGGTVEPGAYDERVRDEVRRVIEAQESLGLDVLVHGEPERNDMVEFFGEHLRGFAITGNGWVQSYGSRCVKPPIIEGDVSRPQPITVELSAYAQSLTRRPVKGMLTGPVTLLKWSFPRDDLAPRAIAAQLASCVRDEIADLQRAGIRVVQVDEPALREAMPLKVRDAPGYLHWAVESFRLACSSAGAATQVHTHMCYSEFNEILGAVAAMDADVVTVEASRSRMELLDAFRDSGYPSQVGPGVYDIHSPQVPTPAEMQGLIEKAAEVIPLDRLWINPDCGLKTRSWAEVLPALSNMVEAARRVRAKSEIAAGRNPAVSTPIPRPPSPRRAPSA